MTNAEPAAPGVLRRRWSLALMLERWQATINGVPVAHWPSLRDQVLQEFTPAARKLAR